LVGLISCGEASGSLAASLSAACSLLEQQDELAKKCISAMVYPAVIAVATIGLALGLMKGVVPQMAPLLSGLHRQLPLATRVVLAVSDAISAWGLIAVASSAALAIGAVAAYRRHARSRLVVHSAIAHAPLVGKLVREYSSAVFLRSFGSMLGSGMAADAAYELAARSLSFMPLRQALVANASLIRQGEPIASIAASGMPEEVLPIISAGEASGRLVASLARSSAILERGIEHALKRLTSLIEPVMMICMGGMVGSIALSIMMPIYDVSRALQR
jgi:type II secretory pathway component PulF